MLNKKVEQFLEDNNMTYLFLLLAHLEVERLSNLPSIAKKDIKGKLTEASLGHVAENIVPDYLSAIEVPDEEENVLE